LGTFNLAAGDYNAVGVSRWTNTAGLIIADAVKITRAESTKETACLAGAGGLGTTKSASGVSETS
jgi:hypothetical protein